MHRVAIVGGGFTGVAFAAHLLRAASRPLEIDVVEPRTSLGAGLAYGSAAPEHRINVPSDRMDVYSEDPLHFTRWLKTTGAWQADPDALTEWGDHYSRRHVFGQYMGALLDEALSAAPVGSAVRHLRGNAMDLSEEGERLRLVLDPGVSERHRYDAVGVFTSHAPPAFPWPVHDRAQDPRAGSGERTPAAPARSGMPMVIPDAWDLDAIRAVPSDARVVIAGVGLTMADVVVSLRAQGHAGTVVALSRRALLPRPQIARFDVLPLLEDDVCPRSTRALLRLVRRRVAQAEAGGLQWRAALDGLRRALPTVWRALPIGEQRRALRWLRPFWDVHRFRMAPQVAALLDAGRRDGWLEVRAGRIDALDRRRDSLAVTVSRRGESHALHCDVFVNCTGPDARFDRTANPLLRALLDRGRVVADAHRLGPAVDALGRAIDRAGSPDPRIRIAGPLVKGTVGEVVGVPEASANARIAAEDLVAWLERPKPTQSPSTARMQAVPR